MSGPASTDVKESATRKPSHQRQIPLALLLMRFRWLLEVCESRVACWWLESTGLVAMMLSLYLFISDSLALSLPAEGEVKANAFREKARRKWSMESCPSFTELK